MGRVPLIVPKKEVDFVHLTPSPGEPAPAHPVGFVFNTAEGPQVRCYGGLPAEVTIAAQLLAGSSGAFLRDAWANDTAKRMQARDLCAGAILLARTLLSTHAAQVAAERQAAETKPPAGG